ASLKIEGRMKRPEYCAAAVTACRQARDDGAVMPELGRQLEAVFSRSGFTDGYFAAKRGRAMFGFRTHEDVKAGNTAFAALHELYKNEYQRVELSARFAARLGSPAVFELTDGTNTVRCEGQEPLPSQERPLTQERAELQLKKTGGTPYIITHIDCSGLEEGVFLPASALNALRREVAEKLSQKRRAPQSVEVCWQQKSHTPHAVKERQLHALFRSIEQLPDDLPTEVKRVYLPMETPAEQLEQTMKRLRERGVETAVELQRGIFGAEVQICRRLREVRALGIRVCMVHNLGHILPAQEAGFEVYGGFGLNIVNTEALQQCQQWGLCGTELSFELTLARTARLGGSLPRAVCIYGYIPLMLTRNCPAALGGKCTGGEVAKGGCSIIDRTGKTMQVRCRGVGTARCSEVFNTVPVSLAERQSEIAGADHLLMRFTVESPQAVRDILHCCANGQPVSGTAAPDGITRGMYYRGVE
ncbi:MAG: U32 family peptidase, partial [Ruminococcaceae bacterium]|nr:U32 family peptidase [Oscillospiraceae bacterium]